MREYVPDMYDAFCWHEAEQERQTAKLPLCSECGEPITEDYCFYINDEYICEDCMECYYRVPTPIED